MRSRSLCPEAHRFRLHGSAVTTVLLSALPLAVLRALPELILDATMGCWANATPAVAVAEGWSATLSGWRRQRFPQQAEVRNAIGDPGHDRRARFGHLANPKGVPASGRTRRFASHLQVGPELAMETVKVSLR